MISAPAEPEIDYPELDSTSNDPVSLFSRNACPICPARVAVVPLGAGKTNAEARGCCPRRKTVRRTRTATVWKTRTKIRVKVTTIRVPRVS